MADHIKTRRADGTWVVRAGGAVLAETSAALEVSEGSYAPVIYFPRESVGMAFLERTEKSTTCPFRGQATYYSIVTKSTVLENAAWSYENPKEAMADIKNYLAFYASDTVAVEKL